MGLTEKWIQGTLSLEDVKEWAKRQTEGKDLNNRELDHVAACLHHIFRWYKEDYPIGHFLEAILMNDFMRVCAHADSTNMKVLSLYAKFLYNIAPSDYRQKVEEKFAGRR